MNDFEYLTTSTTDEAGETTISWEPIPVGDVTEGMRIAPLASWTLDVQHVNGLVWTCLNSDTKRAMTWSPDRPTIHVLHHNGVPTTKYWRP